MRGAGFRTQIQGVLHAPAERAGLPPRRGLRHRRLAMTRGHDSDPADIHGSYQKRGLPFQLSQIAHDLNAGFGVGAMLGSFFK